MPPTRSNSLNWKIFDAPPSSTNGVLTRGKRSVLGENRAVGKRKAESPLAKQTKRSAFGDLTNAVGKSTNDSKSTNNLSKGSKLKEKQVTKEVKSKVDLLEKVENVEVKKKISSKVGEKKVLSFRSNVREGIPKPATRISLARTSSLPISKPAPASRKTATAAASKPVSSLAVALPKRASVAKQEPKKDTSKEPVRSSARLSARLSLGSEIGEQSLYVSALDISPDDGADNTMVVEPEPAPVASSPKNKLPPGVEDFDAENAHDPFQVSDYAMDIFEYLKEREPKYRIPDYMERQVSLTRYMRALLVDWMVEVQENFELNHETLYLAVKIVDLYLSKVIVGKETLQLVGAASLFIASKYDERVPPLVDDLTYICDGAYSHEELIAMEVNILREIDFDLSMPLSYRFLRRYARTAKIAMPQLTLARYILELSLMEYKMATFSESKLAAAALLISMKMQNLGSWSPTLEYYSGYKVPEFKDVCLELNEMLHKKPKTALVTVRNKYSHKIFFEVANIPLVADLQL